MAKPDAKPDALRRLGGGRWETKDARFQIEPQSGTWVIVDTTQTNEFGLPLVRGPYGSLGAAREAIEAARDEGPVESPLADRIEQAARETPTRSASTAAEVVADPAKTPKPPKPPAGPKATPEPAWLRPLQAGDRRRAKATDRPPRNARDRRTRRPSLARRSSIESPPWPDSPLSDDWAPSSLRPRVCMTPWLPRSRSSCQARIPTSARLGASRMSTVAGSRDWTSTIWGEATTSGRVAAGYSPHGSSDRRQRSEAPVHAWDDSGAIGRAVSRHVSVAGRMDRPSAAGPPVITVAG